MPFVHAPWWCLEIPEDWRAEEEEGAVVICDPDELGELCLSVVKSESGAANESALQACMAELLAEGCEPADVVLSGLRGKYFEHENEGLAWREWFLLEGDALVMISYCCEPENAGIDAALVDEILETFVLVDNSEAAD